MLPIVKHIEKVDSFNEQMKEIGYEPLGEFGIKGRRYFRKGKKTRTHHIHVFAEDNQIHIKRHLAVRDYLRTFPAAAKQYGDLKETLAKKFPNDMKSYIKGKDTFVKELEKKAIQWYEKPQFSKR